MERWRGERRENGEVERGEERKWGGGENGEVERREERK